MRHKGWLAVPVALAVLVGAWFGVEALVDTDPPDLGPAVVISPGGGPDPSKPPEESPSPSESSPGPTQREAPAPSPSEAVVVPGPAPKPAGDCDPDDDPDDEDWCGPGYGDDDDDDDDDDDLDDDEAQCRERPHPHPCLDHGHRDLGGRRHRRGHRAGDVRPGGGTGEPRACARGREASRFRRAARSDDGRGLPAGRGPAERAFAA